MPLGLVALALAPLTSRSGLSLDDCIERSDRIATVLVRTVTPVRQTMPFLNGSEWPRAVVGVAELWVESAFVGPTDEHFLYALDQDGRAALHLEPGQRYLLFLERDRTWSRASEGTRTAIAGVTHGATLYQVLSCESEKLRVVDGEGKLAGPLAPGHWTVADLGPRIDARLPLVTAWRGSAGPATWTLRIAKDRSTMGAALQPDELDPALPGRLSEAGHRALWAALDAQRFSELPDVVGGGTHGADSSWLEIEVRSRSGPRRICIHPQDPASIEDATQRDVMQRALAVWDALPGTVERGR